ncbi:MAG: hemolysin family protein [Verrucomicrobiota bacterium]
MLFPLIVVTAFTVLGSFVCSLWESTLLSLNPVRLETLAREGRGYAQVWLRLKSNIDRPISAILIINTVSNTGGATIAGSLFGSYFGSAYLGFFMAGLTLTILYFAEIGPKVIGATYAEQVAPFLGTPLAIVTWLMTPAIWLTSAFSSMLRRHEEKGPTLSAADIEVLAQIARNSNVIALEQERIIQNAVDLADTTVREIMIPADLMVYFRLDRPTEENLRLGQHAMHTRYPVSHSEDPDDIMGYINYKDLIGFRIHGNELNLESFIRPIFTVKPELDLNTALKQMNARQHHIAVVKTEDGQVAGMVSLEDIIEELVGDIEDEFEFDQSANTVIPITEGLWRVGAALTLDKVGAILERDITSENPRESLGQWLEQRLGRSRHIPGISYDFEGIRFTIQQARRGKIYQIVVEVSGPAESAHADLPPSDFTPRD